MLSILKLDLRNFILKDSFKTLESTATIVAVTPSSMDPGYVYDNAGSSMVTHNGKADGTVSVNIMNPDSVVGGDYEVSFEVQEYYKNSAGEWIASTSGNGRVMTRVFVPEGSAAIS